MIGKKKTSFKKEKKISIISISKTYVSEDGTVQSGIEVETHCKITGYVAQELLNKISAKSKQDLFPLCSEFIAAIHDIGKESPCFQRMIYKNVTGFNIDEHPELKSFNPENAKRKNRGFHGVVTQATLCDCINNKSKYLPIIEGMHHGFRPADYESNTSENYGGKEWADLRNNLLLKLQNLFLKNENEWPEIKTWEQASVIGGFITVADWIASGGEFAKLTLYDKKSDEELKIMAKEAVEDAGFDSLNIVKNLSFSQIFGFEPRNIQIDFYNSIIEPGVYILEAPMGIGKTEAALFAAYKMLERGLASGIYFGLPTQLTSNKIYDRVKLFLEKICATDEKNVELKLLHSAAWLEEKTLGEDADVGNSWFSSAKRGILASFAVGTVDQALMAVMNVKHGMVRAFGLAGKVVILDEVHSYDSYTGTILTELVNALRKDNCTVIILSATLTSIQKQDILKIHSYTNPCFKDNYPLITALPDSTNKCLEIESEYSEHKQVHVSVLNDVDKTLEIVLEKAENGEQVLWIENTVSEAQSIYKTIASRTSGMEVECGLIHSRFTRESRNRNESYWVSLYGKNSEEIRKKCGRILVGTQVLEQSIDIDADFLVTRICPTDMLLQRMGRLYRHRENDSVRPKSSICSVVILAPDYLNVITKENCFGLSACVYSEYVLCRTLEIWKDKKTIELPTDIRLLLESTYSERNENERFARLKAELQNKKKILQNAAMIGLSTVVDTLPESSAQTRYSETESISVLLMKSFVNNTDCYEICFYDNEKLSIPKRCYSKRQKKQISKKIMENSVLVSEKNAPPVDRNIQFFSPYVYIGSVEDEEQPFRAVVVGDDENLRSLGNVEIVNGGNKFSYNSKLGYQVEKGGN